MYFFLKEQATLIHWLQSILRSPNMDCFFRAWNFVDTADFLFLLIPFIWVGYQRKLGLQIFHGALISSMLNAILKELFQVPRPCITAPSLGVILVNGLSFPSGAAQTAIWLPGLFALYFQHRVTLAIGILFGTLLSTSRVYLGVHYPLDLLGGWIVGCVILYSLSPSGFYPKFLTWWDSTGKIQQTLVTAIAAIFLLLHPSKKGYMFASVFVGVQLGMI
ncbi:hypothetical protein SCG7086_AL_00030 [Chlamydiales bacterium SCGC AG-110-P3]|nr:hypothetical protein SCG7086_AL_00030 [Chlamydiales bacterium SCGC AG-110-P3]